MTSEILRCPACRSRKTRWQGWYITKKDGRRHRRFCNHCAGTFYPKIRPAEPTGEGTQDA